VNPKFYLITNISTVTIQGGTPNVFGLTDVHLHASAIVLAHSDRASLSAIRIFGPDAAWPITDLSIGSIEHEISPIPLPPHLSGAIQISYALVVDKRWHLKLVTETQDGTPPEVTAYPDSTPIGEVWQALREKVAEYWNGPNMPLLQWVPVEHARHFHKDRP
jgi:hypothetical protein